MSCYETGRKKKEPCKPDPSDLSVRHRMPRIFFRAAIFSEGAGMPGPVLPYGCGSVFGLFAGIRVVASMGQ